MTTTITKHFVKSPTVGNGVLSWLFADGDQIIAGQPVARFTVGGNAHNIVAPATGRLKIVTPHGTPTQGGNPVGMVHEGETGTSPAKKSPPPPVQVPTSGRMPTSEPVIITPALPEILSIAQTTPRRRGTITPPIEVVEIVELQASPQSTADPKGKETRKKAVNRTYSVGNHQEAGIAKLAKTLSLNALEDDSIPGGINESELVRAGIELLLGLPRPALLDVLRANRTREEKGKWGRGRPRPLK